MPSNYEQETFEKFIKPWWASKGFLQPQSDFLQAYHDVSQPDPAVNKPHKSTKSELVKFLNYVERMYVGKNDWECFQNNIGIVQRKYFRHVYFKSKSI